MTAFVPINILISCVITKNDYILSHRSFLRALQPSVDLGLLCNFYREGVVSPTPNPKRGGIDTIFVWSLPFDLSGMDGPARRLHLRQHSSPGHCGEQTSSPRQARSPRRGLSHRYNVLTAQFPTIIKTNENIITLSPHKTSVSCSEFYSCQCCQSFTSFQTFQIHLTHFRKLFSVQYMWMVHLMIGCYIN
jgi:hypothetical protein